ncbi:hypothetical protein [Ruegeria lacuscaerulensis]|uniref:hypothetical protein n=1 Tax=Ruegeria lacuscaerulensis TaxID=55218 RepID=UPI00147C7DEC|nr:hypothetical protein [Ruegeria lacuscaerulensis]
MQFLSLRLCKWKRRFAGYVMGLSVLSCVLAVPGAGYSEQPLVVGSDRGGFLHDRLVELENLQRNGIRVELRGRICYSTCTMFLGLPGTCVTPDTIFGFHGPSRHGRPLSALDFQYFSEVMAEFYPEPIKTWFMETGRNRIRGVHKIKGSELIRLGVLACRTA